MSSVVVPARTNAMQRTASATLLLVALSGFLFFYGLDAGEFYRTESLRAIIAQEFLRSGNWIVPRLYDEPLLTKPPGCYAAIALASLPVRGRLRMDRTTALGAGGDGHRPALLLVFPPSGWPGGCADRGGDAADVALVAGQAPSAEIDMLHVAWVTGAILFLLRALDEPEERSLPSATLCSLPRGAGGSPRYCVSPVASSRNGRPPRIFISPPCRFSGGAGSSGCSGPGRIFWPSLSQDSWGWPGSGLQSPPVGGRISPQPSAARHSCGCRRRITSGRIPGARSCFIRCGSWRDPALVALCVTHAAARFRKSLG